ncbi:hypothetical protein NEF87_001992 [Candidatus Lokiarchaeum ossiferum]|uniref:Zinc ribbon domain-containing protein n=1 Tax=Candidatus Lokiarchaeum ossiferum TaxID=2951803 RepID=A0ABY6HQD8_9ARCH|nr:hypothetical protein NEF87_001992 [Candidatus Lokiarchaeum sp. B-35]
MDLCWNFGIIFLLSVPFLNSIMNFKMKAGFFVLIHFIGFSILLLLFNLYYPNVVFLNADLTSLDKVIIRTLASYCNNELRKGFWIQIISCSLFLACLLLIIILKYPNQLKKCLFQWVGVYSILFYLFWVFSVNRRGETHITNFQISNQYLLHALIFFGINLGIFLLFFGLHIIRRKSKQLPVENTHLPSTVFKCPYCHTEYLSNIQFCSVCNKLIQQEK